MISHKHKFIFSHVPKVAGTSIEIALKKYDKSGKKWGLRNDALSDAIKKHKDYFVFGFVRDYVTCTHKFLSHDPEILIKLFRSDKLWKHGYPIVMKNAGFLDPFHDRYHTVFQWNFTYGCKFIGRYENLDQDFKMVCGILDLDTDGLPRKNKSRDASSYKDHYNKNLQSLVYEMYKQDFLTFGYSYKL
jgi:hypothetical protein